MEEMKESKATQESAEMQENGMPKVESTFEELGVSGEILRAIQEMGYVSPMPVQEKVIPYLLGHNNDVVALAQTGTGKTAAYGLPVLQKIDTSRNEVQAVIMAPTRELCLQITDDLKDYSKYINGLHVLAVYGGASIEPQIRARRMWCSMRLTRCSTWASPKASTPSLQVCPPSATPCSSPPP